MEKCDWKIKIDQAGNYGTVDSGFVLHALNTEKQTSNSNPVQALSCTDTLK